MITFNYILGEGFLQGDIEMLKRTFALMERVWNSAEFKSRVLGFRFQQTGDSSQKVFDTITDVKDKHYMLDLNRVANGSETAATDTTTGITTIQILYLDNPNTTIFDLVNTLSHEYTHKPEGGGYTHSFLYSRWLPWTRGRPWSVPYGIGSIAEQVARELSAQVTTRPAECGAV